MIRSGDREVRRRLRHDDRRLLFERNHQASLDFGIAGLQRLHRRDRLALRRTEGITESLHDFARLRGRSEDDKRDALRNVSRNGKAIRHSHYDTGVGVSERLDGNREVLRLFSGGRAGDEQNHEEKPLHAHRITTRGDIVIPRWMSLQSSDPQVPAKPRCSWR